jgi:hypothetical protein
MVPAFDNDNITVDSTGDDASDNRKGVKVKDSPHKLDVNTDTPIDQMNINTYVVDD